MIELRKLNISLDRFNIEKARYLGETFYNIDKAEGNKTWISTKRYDHKYVLTKFKSKAQDDYTYSVEYLNETDPFCVRFKVGAIYGSGASRHAEVTIVAAQYRNRILSADRFLKKFDDIVMAMYSLILHNKV